MKFILLISLVLGLSGCASLSDYEQGCRDGLSYTVEGRPQSKTLCKRLEDARLAGNTLLRQRTPGIAR